MLDLEQIRKDLKEMRGKEPMKKLAERIGIDWGKVQRFEKGDNSIWVEDMEAWLNGYNSSILEYLMRNATAAELAKLTKDKALVAKLRRALIQPKKREALKSALELIFPDEK